MAEKKRNSNFEMLRIFAMLLIVTYHIIAKTTEGLYLSSPVLSAVAMPLHVGALLFILITGYFGVKLSLKKIVNLGGVTIFYSVIVYCFYAVISGQFSIVRFIASFLPICLNPDLWFIRTYFLFLLCTPLLNLWLENIYRDKYLLTLFGLFFISIYIGCFGNDDSFQNGKNILNFCFLYFVGHELRTHRIIPQIKASTLFLSYLSLNLMIVGLTYYLCGTSIFPLFKMICWYYDSPILILNSVLLFMLFEKLNLNSSFVNYIAKCVFPIYLLHANLYMGRILWPFLNNLIAPQYNLVKIFSLAIMVMAVCVIVDQIFSRIYSPLLEHINGYIQKCYTTFFKPCVKDM